MLGRSENPRLSRKRFSLGGISADVSTQKIAQPTLEMHLEPRWLMPEEFSQTSRRRAERSGPDMSTKLSVMERLRVPGPIPKGSAMQLSGARRIVLRFRQPLEVKAAGSRS